jgi:Na+/H+ antiporter NhaC
VCPFASVAAEGGGWGNQNARHARRAELNLTKEISVFLILFVVLLVMWLMGFFAFHVAGGLIHLLLIVALVSLVLHLFRGRSVA